MPFAAVGAVAALGGAAMQSNAANKASNAQQQSAQQSLGMQQQQFDASQRTMAPYEDVGRGALYKMSDLMGVSRAAPVAPDWTDPRFTKQRDETGGRYTANDTREWNAANAQYQRELADYSASQHAREQGPDALLQTDPGYQFRLGEGNKAIENAARARGQYFSPSTVKELTRYGQGFASNEFGNVYNRLSGLAGMGQGATNTQAQLGQNFANNTGNTMMSAGNARGAASIAQGNAWGNAGSSIGNNITQQNTLNSLFKNNSSNASASPYFSNDYRNSFAWD